MSESEVSTSSGQSAEPRSESQTAAKKADEPLEVTFNSLLGLYETENSYVGKVMENIVNSLKEAAKTRKRMSFLIRASITDPELQLPALKHNYGADIVMDKNMVEEEFMELDNMIRKRVVDINITIRKLTSQANGTSAVVARLYEFKWFHAKTGGR